MTIDQIFTWITQHAEDTSPQIQITWRSAAQTLLLLGAHKQQIKQFAKHKNIELYDPEEYGSPTSSQDFNQAEYDHLIRAVGETVQTVR